MKRAHFKVSGNFDAFAQDATVTIHRGQRCTFEVRPFRRRRTFALPLDVVAEIVCHRILLAEAREKKKLRGKPRSRRPRQLSLVGS